MAEQRHADEPSHQSAGISRGLKRRGLIAGAAALVAGVMAKQTAQPVSANTDGQALIIASGNTASRTTTLAALNTFNQVAGAGLAVFDASPAPGGQSIAGVVGYGGGDHGNGVMGGARGVSFQSSLGDLALNAGVVGRAIDSYGIYGISGSSFGVFGTSSSNYGVYGNSVSSNGLFGYSFSGDGIYGFTGANGGDHAAVRGEGNGNAATHGVRGTNSGSGIGVTGIVSGSGTGVQGVSSTGIGVYGVHSDASGSGVSYGVVGSVTGVGIGIYGVVTTAGAVAFAGGAGVTGAIAAQFSGPVNIYHTSATIPNGNLYIQGNYTAGGTKSAAVPHPDGTHRLLYCEEATEAWFADYGTGTITGGKAEVPLDPDFAAVVDTSTLHAFCMPHDEHHALHLAGKSATGFTVGVNPSAVGIVAGKKATDLSGSFTWRVVAKRKDVKAERLAKFTVPPAVATVPPPLPPAPKDEPKPLTPPLPSLPKQ